MYFLLFEYSMEEGFILCLYHSIYHLSFSLQFLYQIACNCNTISSLTSIKIVYISIYFNNLTFPLLDACWLKSMEMDLVKRKFCVFSTHAVMLFEASMKPQHICINYFLWTITHSSFKKNLPYITAKISTKKVVISYNITQDKNV